MGTIKEQKTKAPTGLKITRDGYKFTFGWSIGDKDYNDGQTLQYKVGNGNWTAISVGKTTTSASVTLNSIPSGTASVSFQVRGNRKAKITEKTKVKAKKGSVTFSISYNPIVSDWSTASFDILLPNVATASQALGDSWNKASYSWSVSTDGQSSNTNKWFTGIQWQTILVKDCNVTDGRQLDSQFKSGTLGWDSGTSSNTSGSVSKTEDTSTISGNSYTRWFRVRSVGVRGVTNWAYTKHIFSAPNKPKDVKVNGQANSAGGTNVTVTWDTDMPESKPIDKSVVQYVCVVPAAGLTCPAGTTGWNDVNTSQTDTKGKEGSAATIDDAPGTDKCMFIRVNTQHDSQITYGDPVLAKIGKLATPTNLSVSTNSSTHKATVTATNASSVPDSFIAVYYQSTNVAKFCIGIIPHGNTSVTVQCPNWGTQAVKFYVRAIVGSYTSITRADGVDSYAITERMVSDETGSGGVVPAPPSSVTLSATSIPGTIRVVWGWQWQAANAAELSWADRPDAWESTDAPEVYLIDNTHSSYWNIAGLETGKTWYVRVRLVKIEGDTNTYSDYSDMKSINLSSAPSIPVASLSDSIVKQDGSFTLSWAYVTTDGTAQAYAYIARVTGTAQAPVYTQIANTETAQHITLSPARLGWTTGNRYALAVKVVSASGQASAGWSNPVYVDVADPLTASISQCSLSSVTEDSRTFYALTEMPLTITVTGAGNNGTTIVAIERSQAYHIYRPDETEMDGFDGETVAIKKQQGASQITFTNDDLIGRLDDNAPYRIVATVQDSLGQSAVVSREFEVRWSHQAVMPNGKVVIDNTYGVAYLTPIAPSSGVATGDVCDIYRLSIDKPVLVYEGAAFGTKYVDPYPTVGEYGGYRFVFRTKNGDYITSDHRLAWIDIYDTLEDDEVNIIDFGTGRVELTRNIDLTSDWKKDFQETKYLGGSIQGDWNPAVSRGASLSAKALPMTDGDTIETMRRLAAYPGICHVRTKEGSNYCADVQVQEAYSHNTGFMVSEFSISITKVDQEALDGLPYTDWLRSQARGQL